MYTEDQLKAMAQSSQWYRVNNPELYALFIHVLCLHTGMTEADIEARIQEIKQ